MAKRTLKRRDVEAVDRRLKKTNSEEAIAYDGEVVHASGDESVSGSKIFVNDVYFGDGMLNNIIITESSIKQMRDGSVDTYYLPAQGGTLALQGEIAQHTHDHLTSGNSEFCLSGSTATIKTSSQGTHYYEWSVRFNDASNQFVPSIGYDDDTTYGGMFCVIRSLVVTGHDFFTVPLQDDIDGEIEFYYYQLAPDASEPQKVTVVYLPLRFNLSGDNTYIASHLTGLSVSLITGEPYIFSGTAPGTGTDFYETYIYSMFQSSFWIDYAPSDGPIVLNLGPGGTHYSTNDLNMQIIDNSSTTIKTIATEDYVQQQIGDINAVLDEINGEVI